jgi:hypothetical protein
MNRSFINLYVQRFQAAFPRAIQTTRMIIIGGRDAEGSAYLIPSKWTAAVLQNAINAGKEPFIGTAAERTANGPQTAHHRRPHWHFLPFGDTFL